MDINGTSIASLYNPQLVEESVTRKPVVIDVKPQFDIESEQSVSSTQTVIEAVQVESTERDSQQADFVRLFASTNTLSGEAQKASPLPVLQQTLPAQVQQYLQNTQTYSEAERLFDEMV
jgi:hypothetical protein